MRIVLLNVHRRAGEAIERRQPKKRIHMRSWFIVFIKGWKKNRLQNRFDIFGVCCVVRRTVWWQIWDTFVFHIFSLFSPFPRREHPTNTLLFYPAPFSGWWWWPWLGLFLPTGLIYALLHNMVDRGPERDWDTWRIVRNRNPIIPLSWREEKLTFPATKTPTVSAGKIMAIVRQLEGFYYLCLQTINRATSLSVQTLAHTHRATRR